MNATDFDQLKAIVADPVKRARLHELIEKALEHRVNIEDMREHLDALEFSARMDLKIDMTIYKRLVTKASRSKDETLDFDVLINEVLNDIEKNRKF
jgi:hypothetical protein